MDRPYNLVGQLKRGARTFVLALCLVSMAVNASAQNTDRDLTKMSLEDLMNVEVTSLSKKEAKLFHTAAAIFVITREDIRRSGMTNIPELLRLVPGLHVARIDGTKWAISARGFNGRFSNKLLVMIDGRSVYSPGTSGVYWEVQDVMLEDVERIEVIRGPGGTLWGANAVNGVINIITRRAEDTQGGLVTAGAGSEERGFGSARYGGRLGEKAYYRVYGKYFDRGSLVDPAGRDANDGQHAIRGGGRIDWQLSDRDSLTLQGDIYDTWLRETSTLIHPAAPYAPFVNTRGEFSGGNVLGLWNRVFSERSDMTLQFYFDQTRRETVDLTERINTFDLDFQHHLAAGRRHDVVWGLGYRLVSDRYPRDSGSPASFSSKSRVFELFSAFVQDEITLVGDRLHLTLGTKLEHNDYTGLEAQPGLRLLWKPSSRQAVWGSVTRAVKTPSRKEHDIRVNSTPLSPPLTGILAVFGNPDSESEELLAYELGYRMRPVKRVSLDIASFYNRYHSLTTYEAGPPFFEVDPQPPHLVLPLFFDNLMNGQTGGLEASVNWEATSHWKLRGGYSFLQTKLNYLGGNPQNAPDALGGNDPRHQFQIQSYLRLPRNFELDAALYHVSRLPVEKIPSYTRLDARLGWLLGEGFELSVGLQNLLDDRHPEFNASDVGVVTSEVKRSVYGKLTWQF